MSGLLRPELLPAEERTPEIDAVLEGRDSIALDADLLAEAPAGAAVAAPGPLDADAAEAGAGAAEADAAAAGDAPERQGSLAVRIRKLPVPARVKLALSGGKEARGVLARDTVKLVQQCVLHNPRLSLEEVLAMAKNRSLHGELLRAIANQRDWVRQYSIRIALVLNPKTPLQISLGLLSAVHERDMRQIARSKNVPTVLQSQARRVLLRRPGGAPGG